MTTDQLIERAFADGLVVVGRIQGPYGIRGWVHVAAFTDPKDNILAYRPWLIGSVERQDWQTLDIADVRPHKQDFVARLEGVSDRDKAELLKGCLIGVPDSELPPTELDEFYWRDLIGRVVVNRDGTTIGRVRELMETGANDVLVVDSEQEGEGPVLIPFHRQYVVNVDLAADRIEVDWRMD